MWRAGVIAIVCACRVNATYHCTTDEQCAQPGRTAACIGTYCVADDPACPSGQRYDDSAGPFAGQCYAPDDAAGATTCSWVGGPKLGTPVHHTELGSPELDTSPRLVRGDPLTLYFASDRDGTLDIFVAHRAAIGQPFDVPAKVQELNDGHDEEDLVLDVSGQGYYATNRDGNFDIYEVRRATPTSPIAVVRKVSELDDGQNQNDPFPSPGGLTIYYSTVRAGYGQDVMVATRAATSVPFATPQPFANDTILNDGGATLTDDQLVIVWAYRPSGMETDVFYATRPSTMDPWSAPQQIAAGVVDTPALETEPMIRGDGCELFFVRSPGGTDHDWEIYSVPIQP